MKLLVKVAEEGLHRLLKDQNALKEIGLLLPVVKEVEMGLKGIKISKNDTKTTAVFNLKADMPVGEIIKSTVDKIRANAARAEATNKDLRKLSWRCSTMKHLPRLSTGGHLRQKGQAAVESARRSFALPRPECPLQTVQTR